MCTGAAAPPLDQVCQPTTGAICDAAPSVLQACVWGCEMYCVASDTFCSDPCPPGFCDPTSDAPGVAVCFNSGAGSTPTMDEAVAFCAEFELMECQDALCGDDSAPTCTETCTDTCRFDNDDECDDGGPGAQFSECDLGTDCTDCKTTQGLPPRLGSAPTSCSPASGCCRFTSECCSDGPDALRCIGSAEVGHCRTECTDTGVCPEGFECQGVVDSNGDPTDDSVCIPCR